MTNPIRILIVDNHAMMRRGLRTACEDNPDFLVVGEASNGVQAVELAAQHQPDVIFMDLKMPELDGVKAIQRILARFPQIRIIVLSLFDDDAHLLAAIRNGARGYLLKQNTDEALLQQSIYTVMAGGTLIDPTLLSQTLSLSGGVPHSQGVPLTSSVVSLTAHEIELLRWVASGAENRKIASALNLAEKTVANQLSQLYAKIHVHNRIQAVMYAKQQGMLKSP